MEEYKYDYDGVKSKAKLSDSEVKMLGWYKELFHKLGDELIYISPHQKTMHTESGRVIRLIPFPSIRIYGSSVKIVEAVLKRLEDEYHVLFVPNGLESKLKHKIFSLLYQKPRNSYQELFNKTITKVKDLRWERINAIEIHYRQQHKDVTYEIYKPTQDIQRLLFRYEGQIAEIMKHIYVTELVYETNKNRLKKNSYKSIEELESFFFALKKEEEIAAKTLSEKVMESVNEYLKNHPGVRVSDIKIEIKEENEN